MGPGRQRKGQLSVNEIFCVLIFQLFMRRSIVIHKINNNIIVAGLQSKKVSGLLGGLVLSNQSEQFKKILKSNLKSSIKNQSNLKSSDWLERNSALQRAMLFWTIT